MGLTIMSPVSGLVLQRFPVKITLVLSLLTNTLACLMFGAAERCATAAPASPCANTHAVAPALAKNTIMLLIARLLIGLSQAPVIIYAPVWVDEFAPEGSRTVRHAATPTPALQHRDRHCHMAHAHVTRCMQRRHGCRSCRWASRWA